MSYYLLCLAGISCLFSSFLAGWFFVLFILCFRSECKDQAEREKNQPKY